MDKLLKSSWITALVIITVFCCPSQACMLTFYPDFESTSLEKPEIILLLDCSNSMKEGPLKQAKQILLLTLHHMPDDCLFNVVTFGTGEFISTEYYGYILIQWHRQDFSTGGGYGDFWRFVYQNGIFAHQMPYYSFIPCIYHLLFPPFSHFFKTLRSKEGHGPHCAPLSYASVYITCTCTCI